MNDSFTDCDAIDLAPMRRPMHIGATAAERRIAQMVRIDIRVYGDFAAARRRDELRFAVDYAALLHALKPVVSAAYVLLERFADAIAGVAAEFPGVHAACVRIEKEQLFGETSAAVTVTARRPVQTAIGLGANIGDPVATMREAIARIAAIGRDIVVSSLYRSPPWGIVDQPEFYNAAALVTTNLLPGALLRALQRIESDLGRTKAIRYGPRVIDLDILDDCAVTTFSPDLTIPHARLAERAFALVPLAEIDERYAPMRDALPENERSRVVAVAGWPAWGAKPL